MKAIDLFNEGVELEDNNKFEEAIVAYTKCIELDPDHVEAHNNIGTLLTNQHNNELAENHYRAAIRIDPDYTLAHFNLGNVLDNMDRFLEAIESYKQALKLVPTYADAHFNLALMYEKINQPRRALQHWSLYVKYSADGPSNCWTIMANAKIKRLLKSDKLKLVFSKSLAG